MTYNNGQTCSGRQNQFSVFETEHNPVFSMLNIYMAKNLMGTYISHNLKPELSLQDILKFINLANIK